ncbi:hypothetical protein BH09SUM1_BH09SUM1_05310 [soil metagenome]
MDSPTHDAPDIAALPPEEFLRHVLEALHLRWRIAVLIPAIYLAGALAIQRTNFPGPAGLAPVSETASIVFTLFGAAIVGVLWKLLTAMRWVQLKELSLLSSDRAAFLAEAKSQLIRQLSLCDLAASPGLILFITQGSFAALAVFLIASMAMYLRAMPSERRIGEALLRPDLFAR